MSTLHLFAHMDKNLVKKGDRVIAYTTPIGTIGNGNTTTSSNKMYAHLHHEISDDRSTE